MRVGMEASGHARWFERLLEELKLELWTGDAAVIRAKRVRKKKTNREDASIFCACCGRMIFRGSGDVSPSECLNRSQLVSSH